MCNNLSTLVLFVTCFCLLHGFPTVYKFNENKVLEPDLVPVSSTVIPLPVYQVSYGVNVKPSLKDDRVKRPEGPISLVTVHTKKKASDLPKPKLSDVSSIKQVSKKEFQP